MKSIMMIYIFLLMSVTCMYADTNNSVVLTLEHLDKISNILEPSAQVIATQVQSFGTNLTIIVSIIITLMSFFGYFGFYKPLLNKSKKIEKKIKREVQNQIIYSTDGELDKAKAYAIKKIDFEIKNVKKTAYEKLFAYQELVYEVNQTIKAESDAILAKEDSNYEDKLKKIISLQYIYNEITNHDLPKLFSDDIDRISGVSKQLSEHKNIQSIITIYLSGLLKLDKWSLEEKEVIKKVLKDYYHYKY